VLSSLPAGRRAALTGQSFFPGLLQGPFHGGLIVVFTVSAVLSVLAGLASLLRASRRPAGQPGAEPAAGTSCAPTPNRAG
jgi:hypothetical protein